LQHSQVSSTAWSTGQHAYLEVLDAAWQLVCIQLLQHVMAYVKEQQASKFLQALHL
jgi:hypothetical protein